MKESAGNEGTRKRDWDNRKWHILPNAIISPYINREADQQMGH